MIQSNTDKREASGTGNAQRKGGKGYRIKHAQILLKLDDKPENKEWTYEHIQNAYNAASATVAGVAKRFVFEGLESALGRKKHDNYHRKVTGEVRVRQKRLT